MVTDHVGVLMNNFPPLLIINLLVVLRLYSWGDICRWGKALLRQLREKEVEPTVSWHKVCSAKPYKLGGKMCSLVSSWEDKNCQKYEWWDAKQKKWADAQMPAQAEIQAC